jgi:hypothetical protein
MFTVSVIKGAFECKVVGSRVYVSCIKKTCKGKSVQELSSEGFSKSHNPKGEASREAFRTQRDVLFRAKASTSEKQDFANAESSGNVLKGQLLTPCAADGRPSGVRRVLCPYCMQAGVLTFKAIRISPGSVGVTIREDMNHDGIEHVLLRARRTFVMLRSIDYLARTGTISATAHVVCPGASIQMPNQKDLGFQDAHQVLRELTIDGRYLYEFPVSPMREAMAYCLSVVSHLPAVWNEVDCLIESAITIPMILLGQNCVNGSLRRRASEDSAFFELLWSQLVSAYLDAVDTAMTEAVGIHLETLSVYRSSVRALAYTQTPGFVHFNPVKLWKDCLSNSSVVG